MFTEFYGKILKKSREFSHYSDSTLNKLALYVKEVSFSPGETIY
jgi:hypothetical protein